MKQVLLLLFFLHSVLVNAQTLSKITLSETGNVSRISFDLDESIQFNITQEGTVIDWGVDLYKNRGINYYNKLEAYTGKTEYYKETDNESLRGKIKYIGRTLITYYASYEDEILRGKIKALGKIKIEYYPKYENEAIRGRIQSARATLFTYFPAFGKDPNTGKLKSVGNTNLAYYGAYDDKAFAGKIKSIGSSSYVYYGSSEAREYRGRIKNGSQFQAINGIRFQLTM